MNELLQAVRQVGIGELMALQRGYKRGWEELLRGYVGTKTIHAMLEIGLIDEMAKAPVNVQKFADAHDLDFQILNALCESMYSMGFLDRNGLDFSLSENGRALLDAFRGWLEVSCGYQEIFSSLEPMLRKRKIYGKDFYRKSDYVARGSGQMNDPIMFPLAADIVRRNNYRKVLDLGCGDGTFLRKLCRGNSDVTAYGIDLAPEAIADGKRLAQREGLENRTHLFAGNICKLNEFTESLEGLDAATIFFVLHELLYSSEQLVINFVSGFRKRFPGVPLIAFEAIRPTADEMRKHPGIAIYYYLYHELSEQKPVSREKWHELFQRAGSRVSERYLPYAKIAIYTLQ